MRYLLMNGSNVVNVILLNAVEDYTPASGLTLLEAPEGVGIGWVLDGDEWSPPVVEVSDEPEQSIPDRRQGAYEQEADPLFFKWQRGEATEQEWLDKVQQIRERYPYPENNEGEK